MRNFEIVSLFSGAGGLDAGFEKAGSNILVANEYDKHIWSTYEHNFPDTILLRKSIKDISPSELPRVDGIIGGPPCQSWSEAGRQAGIVDQRGQLLFEYLRIIKETRPLFFLAENVSGLLFEKHNSTVMPLLEQFAKLGYNISFGMVDANDYNVPQNRVRVIIVGYQTQTGKTFCFPETEEKHLTLRDAIWNLRNTAKPALNKTFANNNLKIQNHEYLVQGFSPMFMSRNRVRSWDEPSFTIQATGRQIPLHPQAPKMVYVDGSHREFVKGKEHLYRRFTVREAARIQTFPDAHEFLYKNILTGYKMVGNAVPVELAYALAKKIQYDLSDEERQDQKRAKKGSITRL